MTSRPARIVDAHVHLWDPARTDWYPYLSAGQDELNMGDVSGMSRRFDVPIYLAESAGWNVEKLVNVAAATGVHSIEETLELDRRADTAGHPDAIVGGLPPSESVAKPWPRWTNSLRRLAFGASARWECPRLPFRRPTYCTPSGSAGSSMR